MSNKESPSKLLNKNNHIMKQWDKNRPSHWNSILRPIFNMSFFPNDKSFRETTCRFVYILVFKLCKKYMNLKTRCDRTACRFIYYRDTQPQNRQNDVSFLERTCNFGKRHLLNIGFYITIEWEYTNAQTPKNITHT